MYRMLLLGMGLMSLGAFAAVDSNSATVARAVAGDSSAIASLRAEGQRGLDTLIATRKAAPALASVAAWDAAIDAVAAQRDARYSELYWHTDMDAARVEAVASGKPILSLRLLGVLTEEHSCANSRFFRAALYSNPEISAYLREHYVLHWSSERPAPKMTVDLGDGRQIVRTITGNSAHYVLDSLGRPLDVIPGMYGPGAFLTQLEDGAALHARVDGTTDAERARRVSRWHQARKDAALKQLGAVVSAPDAAVLEQWVMRGDQGVSEYMAMRAMSMSMSKAVVEMPSLDSFIPGGSQGSWMPDDDRWRAIGQQLYPGQSQLHHNSIALIDAQQPLSPMTLADPGAARAEMLRRFQADMGGDTARNELTLHARVHGWFADGAVEGLGSLNRRVYDELFETPADDPWMGLLVPDVYTGLSRGGVR